jgi:hypothetical protein
MKQRNGSKKSERRILNIKTKTDKSKSTEVKPNAKEDLKSIPLAEIEKNWKPHLTVLS